MSETPSAATLRLLAATNGGPVDSGIVSRDIACSVKSACTAITRLGNAGTVFLHRAVAGKLIYVFSSEAHFLAYGLAEVEADALKRVRERTTQAAAGRNRAIEVPAGFAATVTIKIPCRTAWANKEADTSRAKVTICPAPTSYSRTYVDPKTSVVGGFATMGIGRYSE
jgi:hypothetical protein